MLNISENSIAEFVDLKRFKAFRLLRKKSFKKFPLYLGIVLLAGLVISLFLPWTQNIEAKIKHKAITNLKRLNMVLDSHLYPSYISNT